MALHGDVRVNNRVIATWSARRLQHPPKDVNTYECEVVVFSRGNDSVVEAVRTFELDHVFEDGALILASEVLSRAYSLADPHDKWGL